MLQQFVRVLTSGLLLVAAWIGIPGSLWSDELPDLRWLSVPAAWKRPAGRVVRVGTVPELERATANARPGDVIEIADGHYMLAGLVRIKVDDLVLCGASGNRDKVVLDGQKMRGGELLVISGCQGGVVADLTIQNVRWNGIKFDTDQGTTRVTVHNCVLHNIWQRAIKGTKVARKDVGRQTSADVRVQHCLFYNDRPKELADDLADATGDYIGGIDAMHCRDWVVSDNVFCHIQGRTRQARGAVFLWHDSRDCTLERNVVIDCDAGLCLGNSQPPEQDAHCIGCVVRNNFVAGAPETGVLADYTRDCRIVHNTIWDPQSSKRRLIRLVHDNPGLVVANNLLVGPELSLESKSPITLAGNVTVGAGTWLVDSSAGNLHLQEAVRGITNAGAALEGVARDFDGETPTTGPTLGPMS